MHCNSTLKTNKTNHIRQPENFASSLNVKCRCGIMFQKYQRICIVNLALTEFFCKLFDLDSYNMHNKGNQTLLIQHINKVFFYSSIHKQVSLQSTQSSRGSLLDGKGLAIYCGFQSHYSIFFRFSHFVSLQSCAKSLANNMDSTRTNCLIMLQNCLSPDYRCFQLDNYISL